MIPDGTRRRRLQPRIYTPSDRPGGRFPHIWLDPARQAFDARLVRQGIDAGHRARWAATGSRRGAASPRTTGMPLRCEQLPRDGRDDGMHMGLRGAVLVRPDGHVAWRMPYLPSDPERHLQKALQGLLA